MELWVRWITSRPLRTLAVVLASTGVAGLGIAVLGVRGHPLPIDPSGDAVRLPDLLGLFGLGIGALTLSALLAFRTLRAVLAALGTIVVATAWTLAALAWLGHPLGRSAGMVAVFVVAIGFAYAIHVVSECSDLVRRGRAIAPAAADSLRRLAVPLLLAAFATGAGLVALRLSPTPALRDVWPLAAIGVACAAIAACSVAPAALALGAAMPPARAGTDALELMAGRLARFALRHRRSALVGAAFVAAAALFGATRVREGADPRSLALALAVVYVVLASAFTGLRVGLRALTPIALPVMFGVGLLGFLGVPLDAATSVPIVVALGIAVVGTVQYMARFGDEARRLADEQEAAVQALGAVGLPIATASLGLCLGALVLDATAAIPPRVGVIASATLAFTGVTVVLVTPALCGGLRVVTLWDSLTLDLGADPTHTIPIFRGLSSRQARVVCLMARIRTFARGDDLFRSGDIASELYVVIDGELRSILRRPAGDVILATHGRGDIVGEVALYHGKRTADVGATSEARALALTRRSIDRLIRRRPRIAAVVLRNLNETLANRVAGATDRLA